MNSSNVIRRIVFNLSKPKINIIWDVIAMPDLRYIRNNKEIKFYRRIIENECKRALIFSKDANNGPNLENEIEGIKIKYLNNLREFTRDE